MRFSQLHGFLLCMVRIVVATTARIYFWQRPEIIPHSMLTVVNTLLMTVLLASCIFLIVWCLIPRFIMPQLIFDATVVSFVLYLTGGVASPFLFLFFVVVALGGAWGSIRTALAFATAFLAAASTITLLYIRGITFFIPSDVVKAGLSNWQARLVMQGSLALLVALLSGRLAYASRSVQLLYRPILDNIGEGVFAMLKSGKVIYANRRLLEILSIKETNDITGKDIWDVLSAPRFSEIRAVLRKGFTTAEIEMQDSDGSAKVFEIRCWLLRGHRGRAIGKVVMLSDLTVRRQLEQTRARANRLRELEEMAVGLAHELRNPLASIRGCAQQLAKLRSSNTLYKELADIIVRESDRLDNIVARFMDLARPRPLMAVRTDMAALIEEVVNILRRRPEAASTQIAVKNNRRAVLHCDPERIKQVFLNIAINALEAMRGSGKLSIELTEGPPDALVSEHKTTTPTDGIIIRFTDTGPGIRSKDLDKIFLPFFTTKADGVGMGLAIANKNVAEHGGFITVDSHLGKGTTFAVWLPRVPKRSGGRSVAEGAGG